MRRRLAVLALGVATLLACDRALAQEAPPQGEGAVGGALLGGEIVLVGEALAGVEPLWAYVLGGGLAVAGGAYAGLMVEKNADADISAWMLGGGFVLLLPTVVWVGNARSEKVPPEPVTIARIEPEPGRLGPALAPQPAARRVLYLPLVSGTF